MNELQTQTTTQTSSPTLQRKESGQKPQLLKKASSMSYDQGSALLSPQEPMLQKKDTGKVDEKIKDGKYGWKAGYDVKFGKSDCQVTIKAKINAQTGVTIEDVTNVKKQTRSAFSSMWNNKFKITDKGEKKTYPLKFAVVFTSSNPHLTIKLHKGAGRDNLSNWYVNSDDQTRAHELGHQLGLRDEYIDSGVDNRKDSKAGGVYTDNSIMGNFYNEGKGKAAPKLRHGNQIAGMIGEATGRDVSASMAKGVKKGESMHEKDEHKDGGGGSWT